MYRRFSVIIPSLPFDFPSKATRISGIATAEIIFDDNGIRYRDVLAHLFFASLLCTSRWLFLLCKNTLKTPSPSLLSAQKTFAELLLLVFEGGFMK